MKRSKLLFFRFRLRLFLLLVRLAGPPTGVLLRVLRLTGTTGAGGGGAGGGAGPAGNVCWLL